MLRFHNVSAYLANLHGGGSRKDAKHAKEAPRISSIDTYLSFFTLAVGSWLLANLKLRQPKAKG